MALKAAVYVRRSGAFGLGHVGWCFGVDATLFDAGSVENPQGTPVTPPDQMGFWNCGTTIPSVAFRHRGYDFFKVFTVAKPDVAAALNAVQSVREQPYFVLGRNCMDDTYDVLRAFGLLLPPPYLAWFPNVWFDELKPVAQPLTNEPTLRLDGQKYDSATWSKLPPVIKPILFPHLYAMPLPWRSPGTKEFAKFDAEIRRIPNHPKHKVRGEMQ